MTLLSGKLYYVHIGNVAFGNLPEKMLQTILGDGRHASPFAERWLEHNHIDLQYITGDKSYDFIKDGNDKTETKGYVVNKRKVELVPSNMLGEGRKYSEEKFLQYLQEKKFFIIHAYFSEKNILLYFLVDATFIANNGSPLRKMSFKKINSFLGYNIEEIANFLHKNLYSVKDKIYSFDLPFDPQNINLS